MGKLSSPTRYMDPLDQLPSSNAYAQGYTCFGFRACSVWGRRVNSEKRALGLGVRAFSQISEGSAGGAEGFARSTPTLNLHMMTQTFTPKS